MECQLKSASTRDLSVKLIKSSNGDFYDLGSSDNTYFNFDFFKSNNE